MMGSFDFECSMDHGVRIQLNNGHYWYDGVAIRVGN